MQGAPKGSFISHSTLHSIYRKARWINEIFSSCSLSLSFSPPCKLKEISKKSTLANKLIKWHHKIFPPMSINLINKDCLVSKQIDHITNHINSYFLPSPRQKKRLDILWKHLYTDFNIKFVIISYFVSHCQSKNVTLTKSAYSEASNSNIKSFLHRLHSYIHSKKKPFSTSWQLSNSCYSQSFLISMPHSQSR